MPLTNTTTNPVCYVPDAASLQDMHTGASDKVTYMFWLKPGGSNVWASILWKTGWYFRRNSSATQIQLQFRRTTTHCSFISNTGFLSTSASAPWQFWCVTIDQTRGGDLIVAYEGEPENDASLNTVTWATNDNGAGAWNTDVGDDLRFGNRGQSAREWDGAFGPIIILSGVALTLQEANEYYRGYFTRKGPSVCVLETYPGWNGTSTCIDYSGNANHTASMSNVAQSEAGIPLWRSPFSVSSPFTGYSASSTPTVIDFNACTWKPWVEQQLTTKANTSHVLNLATSKPWTEQSLTTNARTALDLSTVTKKPWVGQQVTTKADTAHALNASTWKQWLGKQLDVYEGTSTVIDLVQATWAALGGQQLTLKLDTAHTLVTATLKRWVGRAMTLPSTGASLIRNLTRGLTQTLTSVLAKTDDSE